MQSKPVTFRVIYFPKVRRYIAVAWNYDIAALVSTRDHATYTEARAELDKTAAELALELRWFDGEYKCVEGELVPATSEEIRLLQIK